MAFPSGVPLPSAPRRHSSGPPGPSLPPLHGLHKPPGYPPADYPLFVPESPVSPRTPMELGSDLAWLWGPLRVAQDVEHRNRQIAEHARLALKRRDRHRRERERRARKRKERERRDRCRDCRSNATCTSCGPAPPLGAPFPPRFPIGSRFVSRKPPDFTTPPYCPPPCPYPPPATPALSSSSSLHPPFAPADIYTPPADFIPRGSPGPFMDVEPTSPLQPLPARLRTSIGDSAPCPAPPPPSPASTPPSSPSSLHPPFGPAGIYTPPRGFISPGGPGPFIDVEATHPLQPLPERLRTSMKDSAFCSASPSPFIVFTFTSSSSSLHSLFSPAGIYTPPGDFISRGGPGPFIDVEPTRPIRPLPGRRSTWLGNPGRVLWLAMGRRSCGIVSWLAELKKMGGRRRSV
ncbi:hypothetical protein MMC08_001980 [Hypocenomyce scalaris]|nr:hypothetical protein [Hypocenomyce scalaris]